MRLFWCIYDKANHIYIAIPMYNLTEYSDNYSETPGSLWQFKRDYVPPNNDDLTVNNSQSFKHKAVLIGKTANALNNINSSVKTQKIIVPLKYLCNFWTSLGISLINCKIHPELNWILDCILSSAEDYAKFKITDATLHVPIVILSTEDNVNLTKQLSDEFKISFYWNRYQAVPAKLINQGTT